MTISDWVTALQDVIDLSQPMFEGMPHWPNNPPYHFALTRQHGDRIMMGGTSAAVETFTTSAHSGTHIDALNHFSQDLQLHGQVDAQTDQSRDFGISHFGVETISLQPRRGVLLDVAKSQGVCRLPLRYGISAEDLASAQANTSITVTDGDAVLIRTGWGGQWQDWPTQATLEGSGVAPSGAEWLASRRVGVVGTDTPSFEQLPNVGWPVHVALLVRYGIPIVESLNMETLSTRNIEEFLWVALPLNMGGATGSMLRPIAIVPS